MALNEHIKKLVQSDDIKRLKMLKKWLSAFHLKATETSQVNGRNIILNDRPVVNFGSCNYLGLDHHPAVLAAVIEGAKTFGNHAGCSRIFSSHSNILELERQISSLVGADRTLLCANVSQVHEGAIPALFSGPDCVLFIDRFAHTSIFQAAMIAKAKGATIERVDITDDLALKRKLSGHIQKTKVLLVDGIYSMHGHIPDFTSLSKLCELSKTILYVDDAHGLGIRGKQGAGIVEEFNLNFENLLLIGSLQKGLGCFGGFISGSEEVIELLRMTSKSYIFSGPIQPHAVHGALAALKISRSQEGLELRNRIKTKSEFIRTSLNAIGFQVSQGDTPIISVPIGEEMKTLMAGRKLFDEGIYLNSVLFPAVPRNEGLLRISLTASHSDEDIELVISAFERLHSYLQVRTGWLQKFQFAYEITKSHVQGSQYAGLQK